VRRWQFPYALAILALAILACGNKAPDYILRGWTVTPPPLIQPTPAPTIIYVYPTPGPTPTWTPATVRVDQLEIRAGPGTNFPGDPSVYLSSGDIVKIITCRYDKQGEAWVNFYWPAKKLYGWVAVTYHGAIFIWPMPGRCTNE